MRDAFKVFFKFMPRYKGYFIMDIIFNLLSAVFGIFSMVALIPVLKVLFHQGDEVYSYQEVHFSLFPMKIPRDELMNNMYAWVGEVSNSEGPTKALVLVATFGVIMVFLKTGFAFLAGFSMVKIKNHITQDLRDNLFRKITALPIGYFNERSKGDVIVRATSDIQEVEVSIIQSMNMLFKNPVIVVLTLFAMFFTSVNLTLFVFIIFPIAGTLLGTIGKTLRKKSMKGQNKMGEILSVFEETLGGIRIIKAFNAEGKMFNKESTKGYQYRRIMDKLMTRKELASPFSEFFGTALILGIMVYGGSLIFKGKGALQPEEFVFYLGLSYNIINPIKAFSTSYYGIQKGLASMDRIQQVLDTQSEIVIKENPVDLPGFDTSIDYKKVWFKYRDEYVIRDVSLHIPKGGTVALVGQSGSGKSTLSDLLPRFYDIQKGGIEIDGINIKDVDPEKLRGLMGIVNQEAILFNDTVYNNIAFGVGEVTKDEVVQAAKIANAHEFILQTENGYGTNVGDRGGRLSGGQRQRISIARAILSNPPILILDEATSALDTESEKLVQEALNNLMKDRTSIVIAHRLSTIRDADIIHVLHEGQVTESGTYEELLAKNGSFKTLHDIQFNA